MFLMQAMFWNSYSKDVILPNSFSHLPHYENKSPQNYSTGNKSIYTYL